VVANPIAGSSGMGAVLQRIAALEARFSVPRATSGSAAAGEDFATSLAQASGSTASATTSGRDVVVPGQGAAALRSIASLAGGAPVAATTPTVPSDPASAAVGARAVAAAKEFLGVPYRWGGTSPSGFDCSGLVQYVYRKLGVDLPRVSRDQARAGQPVAGLAEARPGDLVAFGSPVDHIGIYAGDNKMVVAPHTGAHVRVQEITRPVVAIRRVA
jgi:peptidoglycan DL-endopeptidase CwlO